MPRVRRVYAFAVLAATVAAVAVTASWFRAIAVSKPAPAGPLSDVELRRCSDCHADVCRQAGSTPHSNTLARATGEGVLSRFGGPDGVAGPADGSLPDFAFVRRGERLWAEAGRPPVRLPVDWIFGSGRHAQTPVAVRDEPDRPHECLEFHASWYPDRELGLTIGHAGRIGAGVQSLGVHQPAEVTQDCFGCHTTGMNVDEAGRIDFASFETGVRCDRCHPGAREHLDSDGAAPLERLSRLSPAESVRRCGECHRTAENIPSDLPPDDPHLARFAPVGLGRSACFLRQGNLRFECTTCHDPHRPTPEDASYYSAKCVSCHGTEVAPCPVHPATTDCLTCHMPKVTVERHIRFTDHWIRVRPVEPSPSSDGPDGSPPVEAPKPRSEP